MNNRGQVFIIAAVIIVLLIISSKAVYNHVNAPDNFDSEKFLVDEFKIESIEVVNHAVKYERDANADLGQYISIFLDESAEEDVNWDIFVRYKDFEYDNIGDVFIAPNLTDSRIYYYLKSEKDGETFVRSNI